MTKEEILTENKALKEKIKELTELLSNISELTAISASYLGNINSRISKEVFK